MNNLFKGAFLGVTALILATNPTKEAYSEYLVWQMKDNCKQTQLELHEKAICYTTINALPTSGIKPFIIGYTRRRNYFLFSLYTTDIWGMKNKTIGLGGHFFDFNID